MLIGSTGRRLMGKTTLAMHIAERIDGARLVLDPRRLIRRPGAVVARSAAALHRAIPQLRSGEFPEVVYSPTEDLPEAFAAFAAELRAWAADPPEGIDLAAVIDEASFYGALEANADFMFAVKCSDPATFHLVLTCHRPSDLPPDVRALLNHWCIFRTTQEHDLDVIRRRCTADVVTLVQRLSDRSFVDWNDDDGTYDLHTHPAIWHTVLTVPDAADSILDLP